MSSASLLAIVAPARDVRALAVHLPELVAARLARIGAEGLLIGREVEAMAPVVVRPTSDRSVLGTMNDFVRMLRHVLGRGKCDASALRRAEHELGETPCFGARFPTGVFPHELALRLLRSGAPPTDG